MEALRLLRRESATLRLLTGVPEVWSLPMRIVQDLLLPLTRSLGVRSLPILQSQNVRDSLTLLEVASEVRSPPIRNVWDSPAGPPHQSWECLHRTRRSSTPLPEDSRPDWWSRVRLMRRDCQTQFRYPWHSQGSRCETGNERPHPSCYCQRMDFSTLR